MKGADRRPRFRRAVYEPRERMTNGCRVLLLRLADSMNAAGVVSIPRSTLARELGVHPSRISENIALARTLGFLGTVRRGRPGVTAVYQAQIPSPGMVRSPGGDMVRPAAPPDGSTWCARAVSQVGNAKREAETPEHGAVHNERRSEEAAPNKSSAHVRAEVDNLHNNHQERTA